MYNSSALEKHSTPRDFLDLQSKESSKIINKEIAELRYLCSYPDIVMGMISEKEEQIRSTKNEIIAKTTSGSLYTRIVKSASLISERELIESLRNDIRNLREELTFAIDTKDKAEAKIAIYERVGV